MIKHGAKLDPRYNHLVIYYPPVNTQSVTGTDCSGRGKGSDPLDLSYIAVLVGVRCEGEGLIDGG